MFPRKKTENPAKPEMIHAHAWTVLRVSDPPIMRFAAAAGGYTYIQHVCMHVRCVHIPFIIFIIISLSLSL